MRTKRFLFLPFFIYIYQGQTLGGICMLNTDSIKNKEVINICDGKSMGFVCDI